MKLLKKIVYCILVVVCVFLFNIALYSETECDAKKFKFKGAFYNNKPVNKNLRKEVEDAICNAYNKLMSCEYLKSYEKDQIKKNSTKYPFTIVFAPLPCAGCGEGYGGYPIKIIINEKYYNNEYDPELKDCCNRSSTIAHELIHLWYPLGGDDCSECKVYRIEEKCISPECDFSWAYRLFDCDKNKDYHKWEKEHDNADENYSYSNGNVIDKVYTNNLDSNNFFEDSRDFISFNTHSDILLYNKYEMDQKELLIKKLIGDSYFTDSTPDYFSNEHKVLVISTGEFMEDKGSNIIKNAIDRFVKNGGTLVVFTQQYGDDIEKLVPIPDGESLKVYGWRESQSCYNDSIYFKKEDMHPILSSSKMERVSCGIDGYFDAYPSGSTVLLKRTKNNLSGLLYYSYGENGGHVFLTSLFTDWAYTHSQATTAELKIVRDLITFAKNPNLPISMYDLETEPNPQIDLNVKVKNSTEDTELTASKVKLKVYTPDRKIVLYETEQSVSLSAGAEAQIPINFTLPTLLSKDFGICHTDYELYDADNNLIQMATESDSGRFSIFKIISEYQQQKIFAWLTVEDESIFWDEKPKMTIHVKNNGDETVSGDVIGWWYLTQHTITHLTVGAGSTISYDFEPELPDYITSNNTDRTRAYGEFGVRFGEQNNVAYADKGIFVTLPNTKNSISLIGSANQKIGTPIDYEFNTLNKTGKAIDAMIKVKIAKIRIGPGYRHIDFIETVYSNSVHIEKGGTYDYSGNFIPSTALTPAMPYALVIEVETMDGNKKEIDYKYFYYKRSNIELDVDPDIGMPRASYIHYIVPGREGIIKFKIKNNSVFNIDNGKYKIVLKSKKNNMIAFEKEVDNITFNSGEERQFEEPFVFNPPEVSDYYLNVTYMDETRTPELITESNMYYVYKISGRLNFDKEIYQYQDTANVDLNIEGIGTYHVIFRCERAGIDEEYDIQIPDGSFEYTKNYSIPLINNGLYKIYAEVKDEANHSYQVRSNIPKRTLCFQSSGKFNDPIAQEGNPVSFEFNIKERSGLTSVINGILKVSSDSLSFNEQRLVSIQPAVENIFNFSIPILEGVSEGVHKVDVKFEANNETLISIFYSIKVPPPDLKLPEPPISVNGGDVISLNYQNTGGKKGTYEIDIYVKDIKNKKVIEFKDTRDIKPGESSIVAIDVPSNLKSGKYTIFQQVKETTTNKDFSKYSQIQITGLEATLNSYTLKDKYFDNETILGKSEITSGNGDIENGTLKAEIVKQVEAGGISLIEPGDFGKYNQIFKGTGKNGKLYLFNKKGLVEYDPVSKNVVLLKELTDVEYNWITIYFDSNDILWLGTSEGLYRKDGAGIWTHFTTSDGLISNMIRDIIEYEYPDGKHSICIATDAGISEYKEGNWNSYTTDHGLPSNEIYKFAIDSVKELWISTEQGIIKYNGTAFVDANAPFGLDNVYIKLDEAADRSVWMATSDKIYRFSSGTWDEWLQSDISVELYVNEIASDDDVVWFRGDDTLVKYDGNFSVFSSTDIEQVEGVQRIIPFEGSGIYFAYAWRLMKRGIVSYKNDVWESEVIEKDLTHLLDEPYSLASDENGKLWVGTGSGISCFNGITWQSYIKLQDGSLIGCVYEIVAGPDNKIYALLNRGILILDESSQQFIPTPPDYETYGSSSLCVDNMSRIWVNIWIGEPGMATEYYDGQWHYFKHGMSYLESDSSGGVWLSGYNSLIHVKADLSEQEYTPSNSGLHEGDIESMYMDKGGVLWICIYDWDIDKYILQSFDETIWTDCSTYSGYPQNGMWIVTKNESDKLYGIGFNLDWATVLYSLEQSQFVNIQEGFDAEVKDIFGIPDLVEFNGVLYTTGYINNGGDDSEYGILRIGKGSGTGVETVWSNSYPVNLSSGSSVNIDLNTDKTLGAGSYLLKTEVLSSSEQVLCESDFLFVVRGTDVSVTLSADIYDGRYVKRDTDLIVNIEAFNNTDETKNNLALTVKKISPQGIEEEIVNQSISLAPGEAFTDNITFNENEQGLWKVHTEIKEGDTLISESEMVVQVTVPVVSMEILSPEYAGDDAFDFKVKLFNNGNIETNFHINVGTSSSPDLIDEDITLKPMEERVLSANDTITADKTYNVTLSGDVENTEEKIVQYGYKEVFTINVLQLYREGSISIGYDISNTGGLAFKDDVHFELFIVGATEPLYTIDRTYNLYAGADVITDTLNFNLVPGNYILKYHTTKSAEAESQFNVQASGIGTVNITSGVKYPVGINDVLYNITNTDTVAGNIEIVISLLKNGSPVFSDTRNYYVEPSEIREDVIDYEFAEKGDYILNITGTKLSAPVNTTLNILNMKEVAGNLSIEAPQINNIPVEVNINNTGYDDFSGRVVIKAGEMIHEEVVTAASGNQYTGTVYFDTCALFAGNVQVNAYLYDSAGELLNEVTSNVVISGPDIKVIEIPENLEITAGGFAQTSIKLKNEGNLRGEVVLRMTAFDTVDEQCEIALDPGEEKEISDIYIDVAGDIPTGNYPFNYTLSGMGVENGFLSGNFSFKVNGVSLDVSADFEYDVYQVGETGVLTITVNPKTPTEAPLEAVVNWGEYSERVHFNVSTGMEQLVFNIPVDEKRDDKVFYGIYHEDGKGIYLNDIYLNIGGAVNVVLDKQVYAPGDVVHAIFSTDESGVITAEAFGENYTITLSSSGSIDFTVPEHTLGGSYGVSWEFVPSDPLHESVSASKPFDVSGLVVKVAKSELEKGKYAPGESIKATYTFESNMDEALILRCWVVAPSGDWEYLGDSEVSVSGSSHVNAATSYSFNTLQAGTHNFVYGLYRGNQLVVSGSMGFDVGDAVLIGVSTDHFEYKDGNEDVKVKVDYFGEGTALLEVYLDEELAETRSLNLIGSGSTEIVLSSSQVNGGNNIKALLKKDGLTSEKRTSFIYGTNLPDLSVSMWELNRDNLDYQYKISVRNSGKTASATTTLIFSDNGTDVETVSISALQPEESVEHDFAWSGIGKAGLHELKFEVDRANTVKEFSESNNTLEITEEVPAVFYNLNIEPEIWQANSEVNIITRLINNQNTTATFDLELSITSNATGEVIYEKTNIVECTPFEQKVINEGFNTGVYPAGEYMLVQHLTGDSADLTEEIGVIIEVTKAIDTTLTITPERIPCDVDSEVELSMNLKNMGNVALEDEVLVIEVFNKDNEEIVKTEEMLVSLEVGEEKPETRIIVLNLNEGIYEIRLKFNEEVIAQSDLEVKPGLEMEKGVVIEPRVLIMNLRLLGIDGTQLGFLMSLLQSQDIKYSSGNYILDSYVKFHSVENNVNIAFVGSSFWGMRDELRERVWRGEGLIVIANKTINNQNTVDFLGVKVKNIPKKNREKDMEMLSSAISAEGDFVLLKKNRLKLEKQKDDVIIIGRSKIHKNAVIAFRAYGNGYVMTICAPLKFSSGSGNVAQTITNAVRLFNRDVYTISDLSRILPLGISLKNEAGDEKTYIVKEIQPYGVKGYGYEPQPDEGEELKWTLTIAGSSESRIFYWLKLPDEINSYDIKTEIYEDENKIDEKSVIFEVSQIVLSRIDEIIAEIESLNASGSDVAYLNIAKHKLQNIKNRTGDSIIKILLNLKDSIKAGKNVGKVKNIDVSSIRIKIHKIMMFFSRTLYDKLIGLSSIEINSLSGTMLKDD